MYYRVFGAHIQRQHHRRIAAVHLELMGVHARIEVRHAAERITLALTYRRIYIRRRDITNRQIKHVIDAVPRTVLGLLGNLINTRLAVFLIAVKSPFVRRTRTDGHCLRIDNHTLVGHYRDDTVATFAGKVLEVMRTGRSKFIPSIRVRELIHLYLFPCVRNLADNQMQRINGHLSRFLYNLGIVMRLTAGNPVPGIGVALANVHGRVSPRHMLPGQRQLHNGVATVCVGR